MASELTNTKSDAMEGSDRTLGPSYLNRFNEASDDKNSGIAMQENTARSCSCQDREGPMTNSPYSPSYVYALGRVSPRFPNRSIEEEYNQAVSDYVQANSEQTKGLAGPALFSAILSNPKYRHLVRRICWVFKVENVETYILVPQNPTDYDMIIEAVRKVPKRDDIDVLIGERGPLAPPTMCNGLILPIAYFDQLYASDIDEFIISISEPPSELSTTNKEEKRRTKGPKRVATDERHREDDIEETVRDVLEKIMQMADNTGSSDEHRALNYLAVRSRQIYYHTKDMHNQNYSLTGIDVKNSRLSVTEKIIDVIFSYTNRSSGIVDKWFVRVVPALFPYIHTPLSRYYDRQ